MVTTTLDDHGDLGDYRELAFESLRAFAATNAETLKVARGALEYQCRVPVENTQDWFRAHLKEMLGFKELGRIFLLAARLAHSEGRTNDVANAYLDLIRFGHESTRGGLVTDNATAAVQEAFGIEGLRSVQDALDAAQSHRIAKVLEELDIRQEPWGQYASRDLRYALGAEFKSLFSREHWRLQQHFKARFYQVQYRRRKAMLEFATRAYQLEMGAKPKRVADLVPAYLKAIPQDPLTRTNLVLAP